MNTTRLPHGLCAVAAGTITVAFGFQNAGASTIAPTYSLTLGDATTGDNAFSANGGTRWDVDPGADDYFNEVYERPTAQTYENRNKTGFGSVATASCQSC